MVLSAVWLFCICHIKLALPLTVYVFWSYTRPKARTVYKPWNDTNLRSMFYKGRITSSPFLLLFCLFLHFRCWLRLTYWFQYCLHRRAVGAHVDTESDKHTFSQSILNKIPRIWILSNPNTDGTLRLHGFFNWKPATKIPPNKSVRRHLLYTGIIAN